MTDPRWERAVELFHSALERGPDERDAYLRDACGTDESLYETVLALVEADRRADDDPFENIAEAAAADVITNGSPGTLVGRQIARYRVVSHLGSGGMGDVFRASDPALGRDVALKLLAPRYQADANFHYRLEKEARAASSLNHPNIVTIYEVGRSDGYEFVASELVDGETLRSAIRRGPLPVPSLSEIGGQVAAGLAAAHEAGIIHRDIKPENIMIRRDGLVKIVDFGLAKSAAVREGDASAPTRLLTAVSRTVAGTACYMSPEQALGRTVDHRSDLFAVGVVLYEMATGRRPFNGPSEAAMYDALLHASVAAPSAVRPDLPPAIDSVIGRALEKDRELRYQSAADLGAELKRLQRPPSTAPLSLPAASTARAGQWWWRLAAIAAGMLAITLALAVVRWPASAAAVPTRFTIAPPPHTDFTLTGTVVPSVTVTVSPDGRRVVFLANEPNAPGRLWVRSLDALDAVPLDDTENATFPFWSPDANSVAFFVDSALRVKPLAGGPARTIATTERGRGGSWNRAGVIVFGTAEGPIYQVSSAGGKPSPVSTLDRARGDSWHRFPEFLPDGRHFLYLARAGEDRALYVGSLDGAASERLFPTEVRASYAEPGYILFVEQGALLARRFDAGRLELGGEPEHLAPSVATSTALDASFAVSSTGTLAYAARTSAKSQLTWFDRTGQMLGTIEALADYLAVRLSPDNKTVAVARPGADEDAPDIWLLDVARGAASRFTFNKWLDISPVFSPDGETVVFSSSRSGRFDLFRRAARGGAEEARLFTAADPSYADDWSPDGRYIVYSSEAPGRSWNLGLLDVAASQATPLAASQYNEYQGRISPDGRWLAFTSDETGRPEVYVRAFPMGDANVVISTGGGSEPAWRRDSSELFYLSPEGTMMSVSVTASGGRLAAGRPQSLFRIRIPGRSLRNGSTYAPSADGRRFLVARAEPENEADAITVIVNWHHGLRP